MNPLPTIAIIGRPNVGKSSLMNRILGFRHAIVAPISGVTRDRNYAESIWNGKRFNVVDTGGLEPDDNKPIMQAIKKQVEFALKESDAIVFLCDGQMGLVPDDREILNYLRRYWNSHKILLVVNKLDSIKVPDEIAIADFYELGISPIYPVSAIHGHGVADLLDDLVSDLPMVEEEQKEDSASNDLERIAIIGKPNVGKSLLFNKLIGEERSIVDDVEGTTRDTILFKHERNGITYNFIDTAGLRRPDRNKGEIEQHSVYRTLGAIKKSDLAILVLDSSRDGITMQDKRIAGRLIESGAGCIIVWNKWDVATDKEELWNNLLKETKEEFPLLEFAPILPISAKTGLNVERLFDLIGEVQKAGKHQISPDILRSILFDAVTIQPPPPFKGREMRIRSIEQLNGPPVIFKVRCSDPKGLHFSYQRYLLNQIKQEFRFDGWPVKIVTGPSR
jgi:GTP-binding protein